MNRDGFWERMALGVDLPAEALPGLPLVEIVGDKRVLIENHCAIIMYGCNEIRIRVKFGQISVCGCGLRLARMTKQQLVIVGQIDGVSISRG